MPTVLPELKIGKRGIEIFGLSVIPEISNPHCKSGQSTRYVPKRGADPSGREGTIVLVVMVVVVILTYACYQFVDRMAVEDIAAKTRAETTQLGTCVDSGEEFLKSLLALPTAGRKQLGGTYNLRKLFCGRVVYEHAGPLGRGRFTVIGPRLAENKVAGLRFGLVNESDKLNLGGLLEWDRRQPGAARHALMHLPGMEVGIADALLDWIDSDSVTREEGAEAADYGDSAGGFYPVTPPNAMVRSLADLLPVRGMSRMLLWGPDQNENFHLSMREQLASESSMDADATTASSGAGFGAEFLPWSYYLTTYSAERNQSRDGRPRVYLNDPDLDRLYGKLAGRMPDSWAKFILLYRQFGPSLESGGKPMTSEVQVDLATPARFPIETIYDLLDARVHPSASATGPLWLSPFSSQPNELRRYLLEFADQVTVDLKPILTGRVNLNSAPQPVLMAVPGMDQELAKKILELRGDPEQDPQQAATQESYHESWLLAQGLVTVGQMRALAPYVTTRGDVFRGQIVGFFDQSALALRSEVVLDATFSPPRTRIRRDLRQLGRGYSLDVLLGGQLSSIEEEADTEEGGVGDW